MTIAVALAFVRLWTFLPTKQFGAREMVPLRTRFGGEQAVATALSSACAGTIEELAARRLDSERFRSAPRTSGRFRCILSLR
jgi:hypothetical protein